MFVQAQAAPAKKNAPFRRVVAETVHVDQKFSDNSFDAKKGKPPPPHLFPTEMLFSFWPVAIRPVL
jgi:hypothetical protein